MAAYLTAFGCLVAVALAVFSAGCHAKVVPPVAPCRYLVESPVECYECLENAYYAESDLTIGPTSVTFTNCYSGARTTIHGKFVVTQIR